MAEYIDRNLIETLLLKRKELIQILIDSAEDNDYGRGVKSAYKEELQAINSIFSQINKECDLYRKRQTTNTFVK